MKVKSVSSSGRLEVKNTEDHQWELASNIVGWECYSADSWHEEHVLTRTEMAKTLHNVGSLIFKVRFDKKDGEERVMVGHLVHGDELMGRAQCVDLHITSGHNQRQVDYRTLKELVVGGVHYILKDSKIKPMFINGESSI